MIYYTSDLHLGHQNVIQHCSRPFVTADEMDEELIRRWNGGEGLETELFAEREWNSILRELDDQARHAVRTMILVEYARCKKLPGDAVVKAFDGLELPGTTTDLATEQALKNIRTRK